MGLQGKRVYGIDLGTTYSSISYVDEFGKPVIIPNAENELVTPSVVFFDGDTIVVGSVAKESMRLYPNDVIAFVKRSMGEQDFFYQHGGIDYRAEEISGYVLKKLVQDAEQKIGEKISDVVISCPAYFGINEREATRLAGEIAGLNVRQVVNEPTAAAIAYGQMESAQGQVVLVYDLGGGTFDITMIEVKSDGVSVICTGGDHNLGGKDWDDRIISFLVSEFQRVTGEEEDILEDLDTWQDLQLSAERAKKILSQRDSAAISVTHLGRRVKVDMTQEKFQEITKDLLERTINLTNSMFAEARKKNVAKFDEIIMVGGSTRMPQVATRISEEFNVTPQLFDPDEAVAKGAAILGWKLTMSQKVMERVVQNSDEPRDMVIKKIKQNQKEMKNQVQSAVKDVAEELGCTPDTVTSSLIKIKDVSSKSFGIVVDTEPGKEAVFNLIHKNTRTPVKVQDYFATSVADQEKVLIRIMESESDENLIDLANSVEIGNALLELPESLPADSTVEVCFQLNKDGCLLVEATETTDKRNVNVKIETTALIAGSQLAKAKARSKNLAVR